jgi:hypothetical protein
MPRFTFQCSPEEAEVRNETGAKFVRVFLFSILIRSGLRCCDVSAVEGWTQR